MGSCFLPPAGNIAPSQMPRTRIMYISKSGGLTGPARIRRVDLTKRGGPLYYQGRAFQRVRGSEHNYVDIESGDPYWISGPRLDGRDRLYGERLGTTIDADVREEYWATVRRGTP